MFQLCFNLNIEYMIVLGKHYEQLTKDKVAPTLMSHGPHAISASFDTGFRTELYTSAV